MDRGAWWATVLGFAKGQAWLKWLNMLQKQSLGSNCVVDPKMCKGEAINQLCTGQQVFLRWDWTGLPCLTAAVCSIRPVGDREIREVGKGQAPKEIANSSLFLFLSRSPLTDGLDVVNMMTRTVFSFFENPELSHFYFELALVLFPFRLLSWPLRPKVCLWQKEKIWYGWWKTVSEKVLKISCG